MTTYNFTPIGVIHTCYKEKFGIPRQSNLVDAPATLDFFPEFAMPEAVRNLEGFSHIWLIFVFHKSGQKKDCDKKNWSPMVRPPRLGGNQKVGVFASRSPFRPNAIGMSVVRLDKIEYTAKGPVLHITGADLLDRTPILDIKPYLPYSDVIKDAGGGFAKELPNTDLEIIFSEKALEQIREKEKNHPGLRDILASILKNDPRPAYHTDSTSDRDESRIFGMRFFDFDLKWQIRENRVTVIRLDDEAESKF